MRGALPLGGYSGIKVSIHWTFLILPLYIVIVGYSTGQTASQIMWNIILILAVFACVTLHEFGHALMAKRFKIKTKDITLLPIGGVARMESLPEKPMQEFLVAIAGPLVNFAIAALLLILVTANNMVPEDTSGYIPSGESFFFLLMAVNFFIGVFNLIPAFPMDGGRILRALLSARMSRTAATRIASSIGQFIALGFIFLGFFYNLFLSLIGVFIFFGARSEWFVEQSKFMLGKYKVGDIVMHQYHQLTTDQTLKEATDEILDSSARNFLIVDNDVVVGTLLRSRLLNALSELEDTTPVGEIMDRDFKVLSPDTPLTEVYNIQKGPIYAEMIMPVIENDRLIGVLDMENISEFIEVQQASFKRNNGRV